MKLKEASAVAMSHVHTEIEIKISFKTWPSATDAGVNIVHQFNNFSVALGAVMHEDWFIFFSSFNF